MRELGCACAQRIRFKSTSLGAAAKPLQRPFRTSCSESGSFWPFFVGAAGEGLVGGEVVRVDVGVDEVFRGDGASEETSQHGDLAGVGHGVGKGALEEDLGRDALEGGSLLKVFGYVGEGFVEVLDGCGEVG